MSLTEKLTRPLRISKKINETPEACSLVFEIPPELKSEFVYRPGQFVTLFLQIGGQEIHRSYSLSTSPLTDSDFKITVKKLAGGRGSTFLVDVAREGDILRVTPPAGQFFTAPKTLTGQHYILFAAGSGITPVFSIMKSVLFANANNRASLFYLNRHDDHIIYQKELSELQARYAGRLHVHHQLTQPTPAWSGARGRLDGAAFAQFYESTNNARHLPPEAYLCGPVGFMQAARDELLKVGLTPEQVHIESFGETIGAVTHSADAPVLAGKTVIGPDKPQAGDRPGKIEVTLNGENFELDAVPDQSILETILAAGHAAPYSCMEGSCMACMGKVRKGAVYQDDPGILTEDNVKACETLTCQAKPLTATVKVDFDLL